MTAARLQSWLRGQQGDYNRGLVKIKGPWRIKGPSSRGEFVTYDGATQMARRIQAFWNEREGFGWVKCTVEKIVGVTHDGTHSVPGNTGAYAVRSNMVYLSGGRGPVECKHPGGQWLAP